ncbi:hypothetical protein LCGC14_0706740 [marine sediment metagenome]|uniref:Uncharacterized protein n=1 Tax=marine sediment metagenome TaxID=412755 RepID=A0A0F9T253_9ZZZZ|nr:leucine-rich repeat domain-containing protein [bacterium]
MRGSSGELTDHKGTVLYEEEVDLIKELETVLKVELRLLKYKIQQKVNNLYIYRIPSRYFTTSENHVTGLGLGECDLSICPNIISKFKFLINLSLDRNKISKLPDSISALENLKSLNLDRNKFVKFPKLITKLANLKYLDINQNFIKKLPRSISKLTSLKALLCAYNQIAQVPKTISNLEFLEYLDFGGNELKKLPTSLFKIKSLKIISISSKSFDDATIERVHKIKQDFEMCVKNTIPTEKQKYLSWYIDKIPKLYIATPPYKIAFFYEYGGADMFWSRNDNAGLKFGSPYELPISLENARNFYNLQDRWSKVIGNHNDINHPDSPEWESLRLDTRELLLEISSKLGEDFIFTGDFDYYVKKQWFVVNEYIFLQFLHNDIILYIKNDKDSAKVFYNGLLETILGKGSNSPFTLSRQTTLDFIIDTAQSKLQKQNNKITLEEKFWKICSNLRTWAEHDYNTDFLHYSLSIPDRFEITFRKKQYPVSIPLLYRLKKAGDPLAERVFRKELLPNFKQTDNRSEVADLTDEELFKEIFYSKKKEFKINDFITLKLINKETHIYVKNEKFLQCSRLVLNIPIGNVNDYEQIDSIDEAVDVSKKKTIWLNQIVQGHNAQPDSVQEHDISPEQEFWGHCSVRHEAVLLNAET